MLTGEQIKEAKAQGFLRDKRSIDKFNARVITGNGRITAKEHKIIAEAAEKFGDGYIMMTTRLSLELGGISFDNIKPLREFLQSFGLDTGGTGAKVRPIVSCKGTNCPFGLIDTFDLSREIHNRFYIGLKDLALPHKFKIAVGGCPNNCVKPNLNDVGIIGQRIPNPNFDKNDKTSKRYLNGYAVYIGGRWGRDVNIGKKLNIDFLNKEDTLSFIEKIIMYYKDNGKTKERFSDTIKRIGFEEVEKSLLV